MISAKKPAADQAGTQPDGAGIALPPPPVGPTAIQLCIQKELERYFTLLDGEPPTNLYRMVMAQAERGLIPTVLELCGGNQTRTAEYLGISRGNLRKKMAEMNLD